MTHWGWYWKVKRKHQPKSVCDFTTSIDSVQFFKQPGFGFWEFYIEFVDRCVVRALSQNCKY